MAVIIGVDPGNGGGAAILDGDGGLVELYPLPMRRTMVGGTTRWIIDAIEWARWVDAAATRQPGLKAAVERQQTMPTDGHVGAGVLMMNYGIILGVFSAHFIPQVLIQAAEWRRAHALPVRGPKEIGKAARRRWLKANSIGKASDLWPAFAQLFQGNDGLAEAALIADAGRRMDA